MNSQFLHITFTSVRRRSKSFLKIFITAFLVAFFILGTLLLQDNLNVYQRELKYRTYGSWVFMYSSTKDELPEMLLEHAFFDGYGQAYWGQAMLIEEGVTSGYALGAMDENFINYGDISLLDGRFPETSSEIAMERKVLSKLGCNYELGQEITVYCRNIDKKLKKFTFTLCGILESYTSVWSAGSALPPAIVSLDTLFEKFGYRNTHTIFHLDEAYEYVGSEVLNDTLDILNNKSNKLNVKYNNKVFDDDLWESQFDYNTIITMIMLIGIFALFYISSSYFNSRRPFYYRLRSLGATTGQIYFIILYEQLLSSAVSGILGFLTSIGSIRLLMLAFTNKSGLQSFFELKPFTLLLAVSSFFITVIISSFSVVIMASFKGLNENTHILSAFRLTKLRKDAEKRAKTNNVPSFISRRQLKAMGGKLLLSRLFSLLICTLLIIIGIDKISPACANYFTPFYPHTMRIDSPYEEPTDISISGIDNAGRRCIHYVSCAQNSLSKGIDNEFFEKIYELQGIETVYKISYDDSHIFVWEDMESSPVRRDVLEDVCEETFKTRVLSEIPKLTYPENGLIYGYSSNFVENTEYYYNIFKEYINKSKMSYKEFESGDKVILYIGSDVEETTLKVGDKIGVETNSGTLYFEIGCIIHNYDPLPLSYFKNELRTETFTIIASDKCGKKIATADGTTFKYNAVEFDFNKHAETETTAKMLAFYSTEYNLQYSDKSSLIDTFKNTFYQSLSSSLPLFIMIFAAFVLISYNSLESRIIAEKKTTLLLRNLGMSSSSKLFLDLKTAFRTIWPCIFSILLAFFIIWFWESKTFLFSYLNGTFNPDINYYWSVHPTIMSNLFELEDAVPWFDNKITGGQSNHPLVFNLLPLLYMYKFWTACAIVVLVIISYVIIYLILNRKVNKVAEG